jgi:hypothetical protein
MPLRAIRIAVVVVCAGGIVGMIVASVAGNNNGAVITFGLVTAVSILVLMAFSAASRTPAGPPDGALAERVEARIKALVATGADEGEVRELVTDAVLLGRGAKQ